MYFRKCIGQGWLLERWCHWDSGRPRTGRAAEWDSHRLVHGESEVVEEHLDWEWADVDSERLVWACGGKLFAGRVTPERVTEERELYDFNGMQFEALKAPY